MTALALAGVGCATLGAPALSTGCGASYQAVYEGEVRFEHCYRLDLESKVPLTQRRECWREWTEFYTFGQSRDRIEYVTRRMRELGGQIQNPGATPPAATGSAAPPAVIAPAPTNPFEPPPAVQRLTDKVDGGADSASAPKPSADADFDYDPLHAPPGQNCMILCGKSWHKCVDACPADKAKSCKTTCDIKFRGCVPRCL